MVRFNKGASQYEADFSLFHKTRPVGVPWQSMKQLKAGKALKKKRHMMYKFELGALDGEKTEPESRDDTTGDSEVEPEPETSRGGKSKTVAEKKDRAVVVRIGFAAD